MKRPVISPAWAPYWLGFSAEGPWLDWCRFDADALAEPFYTGAVERCLGRPFNRLFRKQTPLDALGAFADAIPDGGPSGFVFHMSRCGSTLVSRSLGALDRSLVIAEAEPATRLLELLAANPGLNAGARNTLLRGLMGAFANAQPRAERLFVKFDAWDIHYLPMLRAAFPETPWVFVSRTPGEVLVSQRRVASASLLPGSLLPERLGMAFGHAASMPPLAYIAAALGRVIGRAGEELAADLRGIAVDYRDLPGALDGLMCHFGVEPDERERARVSDITTRDAKFPGRKFSDDTAEKKRVIDEEIQNLATRWMDEPYRQLTRSRSAGK